MEDIEARIDRAEAAAALSLGRTKALEYGLRVLIASHPDPERLNLIWQALLVEIAAVHAEVPAAISQPEMFTAGMQGIFTVITAQIEVASKQP